MQKLLSAQATDYAQLANEFWRQQLGIEGERMAPEAIAQLQRDRNLVVDGILAPPTRAAMHNQAFAWQRSDALLIGGEMHALPQGLSAVAPTRPDTLSLRDAPCHRARTPEEQAAIDLIVLHWDECISALHCFHTLLWRRLSAHLLIDADGTIFQTLDLKAVCAYHARIHNARSIGIEINNPLWVAPWIEDGDPARMQLCEPRAHGLGHWHIAGFTPAQHATLAALLPWLCATLRIPAEIPFEQGSSQAVEAGLIDPCFKGICGHFHLQADKLDPGFSIWADIEKAVRHTYVG